MSHGHKSEFLAHHFEDLEQQKESAALGMWLFLCTEVLFFGGLFCCYAYYKYRFFDAFISGSHHLDIKLGLLNTAVLITSSLTMALAVHAAQKGARGRTSLMLLLTIALAGVFLVVKYFEWSTKFHHGIIPGHNFQFPAEDLYGGATVKTVEIFYSLYYCMSGLHGIHVILGIVVIGWLWWINQKGRITPEYNVPVEMVGLYWHFVDIIWIFLFPLLYLLGLHVHG
ncbi:MAG: cytochrome c oxidase subunit 3 family protein [Candidatus Sumerlaeaceae bacterium]|nr:cytochrome c oxidase subunit 3 family protein [Candidatus Sumerlaeaceae bacterium]